MNATMTLTVPLRRAVPSDGRGGVRLGVVVYLGVGVGLVVGVGAGLTGVLIGHVGPSFYLIL
ncbi:hypothetical protein [Bifidobacterium aesculapii]|uniref:hypothetical protein n=1 Tax=Bifidobacterium aesculapii TaxID=1329411 RepID=UPI000AE6CB01|nr:hypothetical protein [Bifidobacterium aesculapii]